MPRYRIRPFRTFEDFSACVALQEEVWGRGFTERVPAAILMAAQRVGGVSAGAFSEPEGELIGFVFGITGLVDGEPVHWSDMLAVRPGAREAGLGRALKRYQRARLLERGVRTMRWTFDPLNSKNAYLNIVKLGATADEYVPEMYGETGSPLHRGIGSDRLIALWRLDDPAVEARFSGDGQEHMTSGSDAPVVLGTSGSDEGRPRPEAPRLHLDDELLQLPIPARIGELIEADPALARRWREATRAAFTHYLGRGYRVSGFLRGEELSRFLLDRPSPRREEK